MKALGEYDQDGGAAAHLEVSTSWAEEGPVSAASFPMRLSRGAGASGRFLREELMRLVVAVEQPLLEELNLEVSSDSYY